MTRAVFGQGTRFPASRKKPKKKAHRLPLSGPGIVVNVPLDCLPEYLALHGLKPVEYKNPYLIVRRQPKVQNDKSKNE